MYKGLGATTSRPVLEMAAYFSLLFCGAMFCHGELARSKPDPRWLTSFYLTIAAGGAVGGLFVGLVAPAIFPVYAELSVSIVACTALMLLVLFRDRAWALVCAHPRRVWLGLVLTLLVIVGIQVDLFRASLAGVQSVQRNFFGVLQVRLQLGEADGDDDQWRLIHGRTLHGLQFLAENKQGWPTSYYGEDSGVGLLIRNHRVGQPHRIGVVGLGVGTLAAYGREGDTFRFYEINPAVIDLAQRSFAYLPRCQAHCEIVAGDARISLAHEPRQQFDVLVLDAFSSDAIPVHLLTREAFAMYLEHLRPDGVLAVHISNVHLDLEPVIAGHAEHFRLEAATVSSWPDERRGTKPAIWALLSRERASLQIEAIQNEKLPPPDRTLFWTDDRQSLFQVLKH
jgi:spermidine synthase